MADCFPAAILQAVDVCLSWAASDIQHSLATSSTGRWFFLFAICTLFASFAVPHSGQLHKLLTHKSTHSERSGFFVYLQRTLYIALQTAVICRGNRSVPGGFTSAGSGAMPDARTDMIEVNHWPGA